jgi:Bifunctional DNA primase/polymerase, N-terminal
VTPREQTQHRTALLENAVFYAARLGWAVVPDYEVDNAGQCRCARGAACPSPGKHPRTLNGHKDATTEAPRIQQWWADAPDANVGVATGASGLVVLDVDPAKGGAESLDALIARYGPLPYTPESLTGGGGRHLLFSSPGFPVKDSVGKLAPGLDIRAAGGHIVVPPSRHASGRLYQWEMSSHP